MNLITAYDSPSTFIGSIPLTNSWFVVVAHRGREHQAYGRIANQGYSVLMPMYWKSVKRGRKSKAEPRPLFGSYMFVALPDDGRWAPVAYTRDVSSVLCWPDGTLQRVPDAVIADLKANIAKHGGVLSLGEQEQPRTVFYRGQEIRINRGPAQGVTGIYSTDDGERVRALFRFLGGDREIELPIGMVEAVED